MTLRVRICNVNELGEGSAKSVQILARRVAVFRTGGQLYAIDGDCKHMKASLAAGEINGAVVTCPMHGWKYDVTTGACLNEPWAQLRTYEVAVEDGVVWVELPA